MTEGGATKRPLGRNDRIVKKPFKALERYSNDPGSFTLNDEITVVGKNQAEVIFTRRGENTQYRIAKAELSNYVFPPKNDRGTH